MTERHTRIAADPNVIIIGAGHNGLACAAYLARAGRHVQVLEAGTQVGGAAITRGFADGFQVSACAHLLNQFDAGVQRELRLRKHGLRFAARGLKTVALAEDGNHLILSDGRAEGGGISANDASALAAYHKRMRRFAALLQSLHARAAPRLGGDRAGDLYALAKLAVKMRLMGRRDMREFLRIVAVNMHDLLEEQFDKPLLKGALAFDSVLGNRLGPRSNNSVFNALHRMTGGSNRQPRGGMGSVTQALAAAARDAGASIRTDCPVDAILMDGDRVHGVRLCSGETLTAGSVISNADPKRTFFELLGARHLEAGFASRIAHLRCTGVTAKWHLALDGLPQFSGLDDRHLGQRLVIAPDPAYVERAFDHAKYGQFSQQPAMELSVPSVADGGLSPDRQHVISAVVQYVPHDLRGGWSDEQKRACEERAMSVLERYAPGIRNQVVASELLTPADIETEFGIGGGHWHHAELTLDQALMLRPVPGAAQYATPVDGLYLCGAGSHPGGGVMGSAGRNAARAVLETGR